MAHVSVHSGFDPTSRRFRCCCGCCHVKTGAAILAVFEIIIFGLSLISDGTMYGRSTTEDRDRAFIGLIVGGVMLLLFIIAIVLLVVGLCTERAAFLIPHLIMQALLLILLVVSFVLAIVFIIIGAVNDEPAKAGIGLNQRDTNNINNLRNEFADKGVNTNTAYLVAAIIGIVYFAIFFLLQIWFFSIVYRCYQFFKAKASFKAKGGQATRAQAFPAGSHAHYTAHTSQPQQVHPAQSAYYGGQYYQEEKPRGARMVY